MIIRVNGKTFKNVDKYHFSSNIDGKECKTRLVMSINNGAKIVVVANIADKDWELEFNDGVGSSFIKKTISRFIAIWNAVSKPFKSKRNSSVVSKSWSGNEQPVAETGGNASSDDGQGFGARATNMDATKADGASEGTSGQTV